jgi:glycosyltransferase involved in cell wall biosynthesis
MKILLVHNRYQIAGGEDTLVRQESAMLRSVGAEVRVFEADNKSITGFGQKMRAAADVVYSWEMRAHVEDVLRGFAPDIIHVHNFFPLISPSVYDAAAALQYPVVQTLHNYRLLCANAQLFRHGQVCHDCLGRWLAWPAVAYGCYRGSHAGSASVAAMLAIHRVRGTWSKKVHRYIVLTDFARRLFVEHAGIPSEKLVVKPNAVKDLGMGDGRGEFALYVGRLSPEKGIAVLLEAARCGMGIPLKVAGAGPLQPELEAAHSHGELTYLGEQSPDQVKLLMNQATVLLAPSLWYEGQPMIVPEAFSSGLPVIASRIGSLSTLISHDHNGLHVEPGNGGELCSATRRIAQNPGLREKLRTGARHTYETLYRPESNMTALFAIYESAARECQAST